jgi:hypothetical protein
MLANLVTWKKNEVTSFGNMKIERWSTLIQQMIVSQLINSGDVEAKDCFDLSFMSDSFLISQENVNVK